MGGNTKTFEFRWRTGYMSIIIRNFFAASSVRNIRKFYRIAEEKCGDDSKRVELLGMMRDEIAERKKAAEELKLLEARYHSIMAQFDIGNGLPTMKVLEKQTEKIERAAKELEERRWS